MARSITCTYGFFELTSSKCVITDVSRPLLTDHILNTQEIPGRDGVRLLGSRRGPMDIAITFAVWDSSESSLLTWLRYYQQYLSTSVENRLVIGDEPDIYYMAIPQGVTDLERLDETTARFTVTFHVPDGYAHETAQTAGGTASNPCTFSMGGNAGCLVKITVENAAGSYTFADTNGRFCTVTCPSTRKQLVIDGPNGIVTHGGSLVMMDLSSDFLQAWPGPNTITEQVGDRPFTVEYYPRW